MVLVVLILYTTANSGPHYQFSMQRSVMLRLVEPVELAMPYQTVRATVYQLWRYLPQQAPAIMWVGKTPPYPQLLGGIVPAEWLKRRWIGKTRLDRSLLFADLTAAKTLTALYHTLSIPPLVQKLGLTSLDISAITGNSPEHRELTQQ